MDGNGNETQPERTALVYLPYPDGKTMEECLFDTFVVYHELSDGSFEEYSVENGKLTLTPQGLCMEVTSFSPYYLSWEEGAAPDVSALPSTGDRSNFAAYALLLLGVVCSAVLLKRRAAGRNI